MRPLTATIRALLFCAGLMLIPSHPVFSAETGLQGTWTARAAERDGKPADDILGHQLAFAGDRFQIRSKDGKVVYAGSFRTEPGAKPPAIDFENSEGMARGQSWKGIYALDGDNLTICDNAPDTGKPRPVAMKAASGSGYILVTFQRSKP